MDWQSNWVIVKKPMHQKLQGWHNESDWNTKKVCSNSPIRGRFSCWPPWQHFQPGFCKWEICKLDMYVVFRLVKYTSSPIHKYYTPQPHCALNSKEKSVEVWTCYIQILPPKGKKSFPPLVFKLIIDHLTHTVFFHN